MNPFTHDVPASRVVFGAGSILGIGQELDRLGRSRAMLVGGGGSRSVDGIAMDLGARVVARFSKVAMHVPVELAAEAVALAVECSADAVIVVGGGSSIGLAKAVAKETGLPIVAVPTTYSGSEMTPIWGLTVGGRKTTGRDPRVLPRTVVYDPELTLRLPADVSAASGMNALAHLVEGLYAPDASPVTLVEAEEGVRALASALPRVVGDPTNLAARGDALYGAWLAGRVLGTTTMGVHHKICHTLGGTFDLPHAPSHSALIAHSAAFNAAFAPEAMAAVVRGLNAGGISCSDAAQGIWDLATAIGAPTSLESIGFHPGDAIQAAKIVVEGHPENPRPVDTESVRALLLIAYAGARPA